jgi:hypothetical protein
VGQTWDEVFIDEFLEAYGRARVCVNWDELDDCIRTYLKARILKEKFKDIMSEK